MARSSPVRICTADAVRIRRRLPRSREPLVLRFANPLGHPLAEHRWFAEAVEELSAGAMLVRFVNRWTLPTNRQEETSAVADVARGRADLGYAGTRAFGMLGVRSLDPLQAPLCLATYAAVALVCGDALTREMLEPLETIGFMGLAVLPGALRKPFSFTRRLIDARDYEGTRLRIHESRVAAATYQALRAEPVLLSPHEMSRSPELLIDGLDLQVAAIVSWGFSGSVTYNVNLWPRTIALVASRRTYAWLGGPERDVLMRAGERARARGLEEIAQQEQRDLDELPAGVNPVYASDEQLAVLRDHVEPVYAELRRDPQTRDGLRRVEDLSARVAVS